MVEKINTQYLADDFVNPKIQNQAEENPLNIKVSTAFFKSNRHRTPHKH